MEWAEGSNPEQQLIDKIDKCEEGDMYEMYSQSQNRHMLKQKFLLLLNKAISN